MLALPSSVKDEGVVLFASLGLWRTFREAHPHIDGRHLVTGALVERTCVDVGLRSTPAKINHGKCARAENGARMGGSFEPGSGVLT